MRADGIFIGVEVDDAIAGDADARGQARRGLPGRHLRQTRATALKIVEENLDECVLCGLCLNAAEPGAVKVLKLYDDAAELARASSRPLDARAAGGRARPRRSSRPARCGRRIGAVDDADTYVCRPHAPGEIADALVGRELDRRAPARQGDVGRDRRRRADPRPAPRDGGAHGRRRGRPRRNNWDRFTIHFADGGMLALRDKRRLGRARLEPDLDRVGPDAAEISRAEFRARIGRGTAPLKARMMDQGVIAGVGNLLADETLWRA